MTGYGLNYIYGRLSGVPSAFFEKKAEDIFDTIKKSKWELFDPDYAAKLKTDHPELWSRTGKALGNEQYRHLTNILEQGGKATTPRQIEALKLREAWIARHRQDFLLNGILSQIKWLAVGSRGEAYMKRYLDDWIKDHAVKP